jgi:hypothetical protein
MEHATPAGHLLFPPSAYRLKPLAFFLIHHSAFRIPHFCIVTRGARRWHEGSREFQLLVFLSRLALRGHDGSRGF